MVCQVSGADAELDDTAMRRYGGAQLAEYQFEQFEALRRGAESFAPGEREVAVVELVVCTDHGLIHCEWVPLAQAGMPACGGQWVCTYAPGLVTSLAV